MRIVLKESRPPVAGGKFCREKGVSQTRELPPPLTWWASHRFPYDDAFGDSPGNSHGNGQRPIRENSLFEAVFRPFQRRVHMESQFVLRTTPLVNTLYTAAASAHQHISATAHQYNCTSVHQQISSSVHRYISTAARQHIRTPVRHHIKTSVHQHLSIYIITSVH